MATNLEGLAGLAPRRKALGYTQQTFADRLGVTRSLLAAWETGRVWPSARWLPSIAGLLHCSVADLYGEYAGTAERIPTPVCALARNDKEDTTIIAQEGGERHAGELPESVL